MRFGGISMSRRRLLKAGAGATAAFPLAALAEPNPEEALDHAEEGYAHNYVLDASKAADHPLYHEGQKCRNCAYWRGEVHGEWGPCVHPAFRDVIVNGNGWCEVHLPA